MFPLKSKTNKYFNRSGKNPIRPSFPFVHLFYFPILLIFPSSLFVILPICPSFLYVIFPICPFLPIVHHFTFPIYLFTHRSVFPTGPFFFAFTVYKQSVKVSESVRSVFHNKQVLTHFRLGDLLWGLQNLCKL